MNLKVKDVLSKIKIKTLRIELPSPETEREPSSPETKEKSSPSPVSARGAAATVASASEKPKPEIASTTISAAARKSPGRYSAQGGTLIVSVDGSERIVVGVEVERIPPP